MAQAQIDLQSLAIAQPTAVRPLVGRLVSTELRVKPRGRAARSAVRRVFTHMSPASWGWMDVVIVALTTAGAYWGLVFDNPAYRWVVSPWVSAAVFSLFVALAGLVFGLYERATLLTRSRILVRSVMSVTLGVALGFTVISLVLYAETTRWLGVCVIVGYLASAIPLRLIAHHAVTTHRTRVLCVGAGRSIRKLVALLSREHRPHYEVAGYVRVGPADQAAAPRRRRTDRPAVRFPEPLDPAGFERLCPCVGGIDAIAEIVASHGIDEIVVDSELASDSAVGDQVMACLSPQCRVTDQPTFVEKLLGEVPVGDVTPHWFMLADVGTDGGGYAAVKRMVDIAAALAGLLLTLPFWPLIALAIRLESRGPAFYRQRRVGQHGRHFDICKFRTMRSDAERDGARWARPSDPRVTRLGRLLRATRLDELPQLWNILCGDMSLVGPRPERPEFVKELSEVIPHYRQRHLIKPGLTGWAQIHYGYGASVDDAQRKLCYDLYYLKHRTIDLDVAIVIRTIGTFLVGAR